MIAYKGFNKELKSILGNGKEETCSFEIGKTMTEENCKTARNGFHCCENPFVCLSYYPMNGSNRFFKVEAAGNIDEDGSERIACTEITLLEEMTPLRLALEGMLYMVAHPGREKWQQCYSNVQVRPDRAEAKESGHIAIARGENPMVKGPAGSILGIIRERGGVIMDAKMFVQKERFSGKWIRLGSDRRRLVGVEDEEEIG